MIEEARIYNGEKKASSINVAGVPVVAQWLTNPTRNYEVAGSVPALAQWVNDPALGAGGGYSSNSTPGRGTSMGGRRGFKKRKKKKKKKKKKGKLK